MAGTKGVIVRGTKDAYEAVNGTAGHVLTSNGPGSAPSFQAGGAGLGDVVGPSSATDNAIARYDSTTGKLIQNSGITIADGATGTLSGSNSGDVTLAGSPDYLTIAGQAITRALINLASHVTDRLPFANVAQIATARILGRTTGGTGDVEALTGTQATALLDNVVGDSGSGGTKGLVPAPAAGDAAASKFLKADGTWVAPSGAGDVVGPASSTDHAIARFDGTTGKLLQNTSALTVSDAGVITFPDNQRQTFNPGADAAGLNVGSLAGDPGTPSNGDLWYDSTANELTARINGASVALGAGGGSFSGSMVKKSANQTGANYTTFTAISFDSESYDEGGWHDNVTNNTRLTVPSGVSYVVIAASITLTNVTAGNWLQLALTKNGDSSAAFDGAVTQFTYADATAPSIALASGPIPVTATDYFEVGLQVESDTSIDVTATRTMFSILKVG